MLDTCDLYAGYMHNEIDVSSKIIEHWDVLQKIHEGKLAPTIIRVLILRFKSFLKCREDLTRLQIFAELSVEKNYKIGYCPRHVRS